MTSLVDFKSIGKNYLDLDTPSLLLDLEILENNIAKMANFMNGLPCDLRPHSKTHKSPTIAKMQIEAGAIGICCQKLGEAEVMAEHGIKDILITNQIVGNRKISRLMKLLAQSVDIKVAVDSFENAHELERAAEDAGENLGVLIEIDIGMGRCGILPGQPAVDLAKIIESSAHLDFVGLMGYEGHCVTIRDYPEREDCTKRAISSLLQTKEEIESIGIGVKLVSAGGTGTYNITGHLPGVSEIEAGSYVFMDTTYRQVLSDFEGSLSVLATVISKPTSDRFVLDSGVKTLVGDLGTPSIPGLESVKHNRFSEEHSVWAFDSMIDKVSVGDKVKVIPGHGCSTVNMHDQYYVLQDDLVVDVWEIAAARRTQ